MVKGPALGAIVNFFIELALLRRPPQDLPASQVLLALVMVAGLGTSLLLSATSGVSLGIGLAQGVLDLALMLAVLYGGLNLQGRSARFPQTATALVGTDTLVGLIALAPLGFVANSGEDSEVFALAGLLFLALVVWSVVIAGHILRHAFGWTLAQGVGVAVGYKFMALLVVGTLTGQ